MKNFTFLGYYDSHTAWRNSDGYIELYKIKGKSNPEINRIVTNVRNLSDLDDFFQKIKKKSEKNKANPNQLTID